MCTDKQGGSCGRHCATSQSVSHPVAQSVWSSRTMPANTLECKHLCVACLPLCARHVCDVSGRPGHLFPGAGTAGSSILHRCAVLVPCATLQVARLGRDVLRIAQCELSFLNTGMMGASGTSAASPPPVSPQHSTASTALGEFALAPQPGLSQTWLGAVHLPSCHHHGSQMRAARPRQTP